MSNKIEILLVYIEYRQRNVIASFYLLQIAITVSFLFVAGGCWFIVMALIIVRSPDTDLSQMREQTWRNLKKLHCAPE